MKQEGSVIKQIFCVLSNSFIGCKGKRKQRKNPGGTSKCGGFIIFTKSSINKRMCMILKSQQEF